MPELPIAVPASGRLSGGSPVGSHGRAFELDGVIRVAILTAGFALFDLASHLREGFGRASSTACNGSARGVNLQEVILVL
jgi:hypothetical protein